jgi:hypothetical protein
MTPKLYRIVSKRRREPEDRRVYLQGYPNHCGWTASVAHADRLPLDAAKRMALDIRRQWRKPARVEAVS